MGKTKNVLYRIEEVEKALKRKYNAGMVIMNGRERFMNNISSKYNLEVTAK